MSLPVVLNNLNSDSIYFLLKKFNVVYIQQINDYLTNNSGIFKIGDIPLETENIKEDNYSVNNTAENCVYISLHDLKDSFINFLQEKLNASSIYDLELILSKTQPKNKGIYVVGVIPLKNINQPINTTNIEKVKKVDENNIIENVEMAETEVVDFHHEKNYCIIENKKKSDNQKTIKDHLILQKYGKGLLLSCLSNENPLYGKEWINIFPDFDDSYGGWWKKKGSLKNKKLEGWFFKIDYLSELLNQELNIICDDLDSIKKEKKEADKKKTVSTIFEYNILKTFLSDRQTIENNVIFKVDSEYFDENFKDFKMILIKYNEQVYSGIPHLKNKCLFFFGNIPF